MSQKLNSTDRSDLQAIWDSLLRDDPLPDRADAIVVGGCSNPGLADRAAELFHKNISDVIVISGHQTPYLKTTEAEFLANRCVELGVPLTAIILETEASNTGENIVLSERALRKRGIHAKSIILIHQPFIGLRFLATAQAQWSQPLPVFYSTNERLSFDAYCKKHGLKETAWKMLGDFKRMDEYAEKGYQTPQFIPKTAYDAYLRLQDAGFSTR